MKRHLTQSRTGVLAVILLGMMAIFVMRLFYLQIIKHSEYVSLAQASQQRHFVIPAERGKLYMMDGGAPVPVVLNQTVYTVIADPQTVKQEQRQQIIAALQEIAGGEVVSDAAKRLERTTSRYEVLARNITRTQAEKLKAKDFVGILYQKGSIRNYPEGQLAAQVLGFVNAEGKGQYGVEGALNDRLKGRDGLLKTVADVRNVPLTLSKDNVRVEAKSGENVALSIDRNVQSHAEEALKRGIDKAGATEGSVMVMNPNNGQVLAMANYPTYNPAEYAKQKNAAVFSNATTMLPFEPGSIVKTFSMATGIDKGVVTPQSTYSNTDCTEVGDRKICNALRGLGGTTSMQSAFNNSLNVGMITIARRLGDGSTITPGARQTLYEYYHEKFGFGEATGIELAEAPGLLYTPNRPGAEVNYANITFGQGMNATMVQAASAFCSVVNSGQYFRPTVVAGTVDANGGLRPSAASPLRRTISEQSSATMRGMLSTARAVLNQRMPDKDKPGYDVGGKTGTSETLINGSYTMDETVATYIGYGGANRPEYVIMVRVAAPGKRKNLQGNIHAAPIFTDISNWMIDYMKLAPKG